MLLLLCCCCYAAAAFFGASTNLSGCLYIAISATSLAAVAAPTCHGSTSHLPRRCPSMGRWLARLRRESWSAFLHLPLRGTEPRQGFAAHRVGQCAPRPPLRPQKAAAELVLPKKSGDRWHAHLGGRVVGHLWASSLTRRRTTSTQ